MSLPRYPPLEPGLAWSSHFLGELDCYYLNSIKAPVYAGTPGVFLRIEPRRATIRGFLNAECAKVARRAQKPSASTPLAVPFASFAQPLRPLRSNFPASFLDQLLLFL